MVIVRSVGIWAREKIMNHLNDIWAYSWPVGTWKFHGEAITTWGLTLGKSENRGFFILSGVMWTCRLWLFPNATHGVKMERISCCASCRWVKTGGSYKPSAYCKLLDKEIHNVYMIGMSMMLLLLDSRLEGVGSTLFDNVYAMFLHQTTSIVYLRFRQTVP